MAYCDASKAEEDAFDVFTKIKFTQIDKGRRAGQLFKITLEKSLFSSPAACLDTINNRIRRLEKTEEIRFDSDIEILKGLHDRVEKITPDKFSKYKKLLDVIKDKDHGFGWNGKDKLNRLVIFTERIETIAFLHANLLRDLELNEDQISVLHGGMSDVDQQGIVENFGKEEAPVRLLLASDVASEGINLHYLSHRMIHFDIPWSLMVFQQRNGRIDRYGQERTPQIVYLATQSENKKIRGDMRILELLYMKHSVKKAQNYPSMF